MLQAFNSLGHVLNQEHHNFVKVTGNLVGRIHLHIMDNVFIRITVLT